MDSALLKYSAKDYFFKAALCHFCIDMLNAKVSQTWRACLGLPPSSQAVAAGPHVSVIRPGCPLLPEGEGCAPAPSVPARWPFHGRH